MSLQGAIEWIQDQALTLTGVGGAYDNLTEISNEVTGIFVVTYISGGEITTASYGWGRDFDNITVDILIPRMDLQESSQKLEGFPHNLARLIQADTTLGANVTTYENITYQFVTVQWGGLDYMGYSMIINRVKTLTTH